VDDLGVPLVGAELLNQLFRVLLRRVGGVVRVDTERGEVERSHVLGKRQHELLQQALGLAAGDPFLQARAREREQPLHPDWPLLPPPLWLRAPLDALLERQRALRQLRRVARALELDHPALAAVAQPRGGGHLVGEVVAQPLAQLVAASAFRHRDPTRWSRGTSARLLQSR